MLDLLFTQSNLAILRWFIFATGLMAFVLTLVFTPISIKIAHLIGAVDVPKDNRRMHKTPKPRFGGLAIFISITITILFVRFFLIDRLDMIGELLKNDYSTKLIALIVGGAIIYIAGVFDDILQLRALVKLGLQVLSGVVAFFIGIRVDSFMQFKFDDLGSLGFAINLILTVFWIVAIINAINLIDGLDGLAAGVSSIAALCIGYAAYCTGLYVVALCMIAVAGAGVGFLPWNFFPSKTFLGDSGAQYLGFILASVSLIGPAKGVAMIATIMPALVLGVPLFDVLYAILRRIAHRQPIFSPDKSHLHHKLGHMGMGQRRSVLTLYGVSGIMGMAAVELSRGLVKDSIMLFLIALLFIMILVWDWNHNDRSRSMGEED